jgi:tripartite-type tricarboxylate transporter receptor subunit TctC
VWFGLLAPVGTPPAIVGALNAAINDGLRSAEVRTGLTELGLEAKIGTAQDFAAALAEQAHEWRTVIEATGVKVE